MRKWSIFNFFFFSVFFFQFPWNQCKLFIVGGYFLNWVKIADIFYWTTAQQFFQSLSQEPAVSLKLTFRFRVVPFSWNTVYSLGGSHPLSIDIDRLKCGRSRVQTPDGSALTQDRVLNNWRESAAFVINLQMVRLLNSCVLRNGR